MAKEQVITEAPLFESAHHALVFAFNYSGQQSPRSPMTGLMGTHGIGNGKGLSGLDGAAQAGMVFAEFDKLAKPHQQVLRVRFGKNEQECPCCGINAPCTDWTESVDALSRCAELDGVHRAARHAMVTKAVCGIKGVSMADLANRHQMVERTLRHQMQLLRRKLEKLESEAMNAFDNLLRDIGMVG